MLSDDVHERYNALVVVFTLSLAFAFLCVVFLFSPVSFGKIFNFHEEESSGTWNASSGLVS